VGGQTVTKAYGRDAFVIWWNPILAWLMASAGLRVGLFSDAQVLQRMEADSLNMQARGYRVVSSDEFLLPIFGLRGRTTSYYKVTYERD
jgi:hypothetical protein